MRSRQEVKALARAAYKEQLGVCVLILLVYILLSGLSGVTFIGALLLVPPLTVGCAFVFLQVYTGQKTGMNSLFSGFEHFGRNLGSLLLMGLFIWLWSLLFFVPGIIKAIAYSMTPYILADSNNISAGHAIKLSMRITQGHKGKLFVLQLSFIGRALLCSLPTLLPTVGVVAGFGTMVLLTIVGTLSTLLLELFFLLPYIETTMAGFYLELKKLALDTNVAGPHEFM